MTFFPAVMIAAYFGGFWPGLLATILSAVAANYFLTRQLPSDYASIVNDVAALILFVLVGIDHQRPVRVPAPRPAPHRGRRAPAG